MAITRCEEQHVNCVQSGATASPGRELENPAGRTRKTPRYLATRQKQTPVKHTHAQPHRTTSKLEGTWKGSRKEPGCMNKWQAHMDISINKQGRQGAKGLYCHFAIYYDGITALPHHCIASVGLAAETPLTEPLTKSTTTTFVMGAPHLLPRPLF
ncbi:hypothetical protein E4U43_003561 [Claviceps pusilla]|uniref:Uncharacterized protein n=1 Tax=Claviceps pusilla TaxID=123648 RepID=A0A9P7N505_9HYPO|nr:hypothetical protein E4U43_003561 [Claviceps pusilla]